MKTAKRASTAFAALLLLMLFISGCAPSRKAERRIIYGKNGAYTEALLKSAPEYALDTNINNFGDISCGIFESLDFQLADALNELPDAEFLPQCLVTVVFAADRSECKFIPHTWKELAQADADIGFPLDKTERSAVFASMCYGLEGEAYAKASGLNLIKKLNDSGHFRYGTDCPAAVVLDYQAAQMRKQGRDIEIIVPQDGTFTFALGIFGKTPVCGVPDEKLLEAGFRLMNGECDGALYPPESSYNAASRVTDFKRFNKTVKDITRDIRRSAQRLYLFSSADARENVLFAVITAALIVIWLASALQRSIRRDVRRSLLWAAYLIILWLLLSIFKSLVPDDSLCDRLCWYAYYIFFMGIPLALLYTTSIIDKPSRGIKLEKWFVPFLALYPLLLALVFTNDFHNLVFQFDLNGDWHDEYSYRIGYFLIFAYCIAAFMLSVILLTVKSHKSPNRFTRIFPFFLAAALIGYDVGYGLKIPFVRNSDIALTFSILSALFLETALNVGLIPTNTHYSELFSLSPLNMQLLDKNGGTVLAAAGAAELTAAQRSNLTENCGSALFMDKNTLLHSKAIRGGIAVWQEDITELNRLCEKIEASNAELHRVNSLLQKRSDVRKRKLSVKIKTELLALIEDSIKDSSLELSELIRKLPEEPDRERSLSYITLLLCYIKRRCNLFFLAREGRTMAANELSTYLDELSEFASYAGIKSIMRCAEAASVPVETAVLCYDFYFRILSWAVNKSRATLICRLEYRGGNAEFNALSSQSAKTLVFPAAFLKAAAASGAKTETRKLNEDTDRICLRFSGKGAAK